MEFYHALGSSHTVNPTAAGPVGFLVTCATGALLFGGGALYILCQVWLLPTIRHQEERPDPKSA